MWAPAGYWVVRKFTFALFAGMAVLFVGLVLATASPQDRDALSRVAEGLRLSGDCRRRAHLIAREASGGTPPGLWRCGVLLPAGHQQRPSPGSVGAWLAGLVRVNAAVLVPIVLLVWHRFRRSGCAAAVSGSESSTAVPIAGFGVVAWAWLLSVTLITLALLSMLPVFLMESHGRSSKPLVASPVPWR